MKTLNQIKCKKSAVILKVHGSGALRRRIMDMGLTKGAKVTVRKVAPLGDPIEITVRGYELTLRKEDAAMIEVAAESKPRGMTKITQRAADASSKRKEYM